MVLWLAANIYISATKKMIAHPHPLSICHTEYAHYIRYMISQWPVRAVTSHNKWISINSSSGYLTFGAAFVVGPTGRLQRNRQLSDHYCVQMIMALSSWCWNGNIRDGLGQYHGCWWHGDARSHISSNHDIDIVSQVSPSLSRGRILITCTIKSSTNDTMITYNFRFSQKISA